MEKIILILFIFCAVASIYFFIKHLTNWMISQKEKDSENGIIIRSKIRFRVVLIFSLFSFTLFVINAIYLINFGTPNNIFLFFTIPACNLFTYSPWGYHITKEGIKSIDYSYIVKWEDIKKLSWHELKKDTLSIENDKGYFNLRVFEKKELVEEFINRYKTISNDLCK